MLKTIIFAAILSTSLATAGENIPVGTAMIEPGNFITGYWAFFDSDKKNKAFVTIKVNREDILYGSGSSYFRFMVPGLKVEMDESGRRVIRYGDILCARQMRVFRNYRNKRCKPKVNLSAAEHGWIQVKAWMEIK